jgi:hypothetical protein
MVYKSTPENATIKVYVREVYMAKAESINRVQATGALLWKMIAGAMGLVRRSGGQIWIRTRFCLIEGTNLGLRPLIFDFCRRVSMCRRLKDHGRDRLAFSVSGWRQVSAHQNECTVAA